VDKFLIYRYFIIILKILLYINLINIKYYFYIYTIKNNNIINDWNNNNNNNNNNNKKVIEYIKIKSKIKLKQEQK